MERLAQLFDEIEDLLSLLRHQLGLWPERRTARRRGGDASLRF
jgi:hypothetical protein